MRGTETWVLKELDALGAAGLRRALTSRAGTGAGLPGAGVVNVSSNDYLGLARHPAVVAAAREACQEAGAGASRLVAGTLDCHVRLEQALATFKGYPAALVFGSGYMTNVGVVAALVGRNDQVFMDRLAHASLVDAAVLSRARVRRFLHNDADDLRRQLAAAPAQGRRLVLTESVFSMDGDVAPLAALAAAAGEWGAMLLVDEAHATGVFGPGGAGLIRQAGVEAAVTISMGTLSKALGGYGGFVACSAPMREWLVNRARSFMYSTALPPAMAGAALGALEVLRQNPDMGETLLARAASFRRELADRGFDTGASRSQIIPLMVGDNERAMRLHGRLLEQGVLAIAIRPPTVPRGTARLRLSLRLDHDAATLGAVLEILQAAARAEGGEA
jgi:8-amino-7-oxononanoate synthase